ncbi:MAG TPA: GNAT family N-acetyltransferase [Parvularculaceae bacterium]|nr:GNAT family N-acetyltransferase [Parvularculaceae bacterium]
MSIQLETERLLLRPFEPEDFESVAAMMAEQAVADFLTLDKKPQSRAASWRSFTSMLGHWRIRGFGFFSVFEKSSGAWVGRVGPWQPEDWPSVECGWAITPAHWGKGYAPEAAIATINWIFAEKPALTRIISLIDPTNANSQAVARKIGEAKTRETFRIETLTVNIWAAGRSGWLARFGR